MGAGIVILLIILIGMFIKFQTLQSDKDGLKGFYQSEPRNGKVYQANFDYHTEEYYIIQTGGTTAGTHILSKGNFELYKDNIYLLTDEEDNEMLLTLLKDSFYYKNPENEDIVELKNISRVPTYLNGMKEPEVETEEAE